jgi:hypothetical protein
MSDYCEYCGKRLHWPEHFPCPTCKALRQLIAENPQRARDVLDRQRLETYLRNRAVAYAILLAEVEDE